MLWNNMDYKVMLIGLRNVKGKILKDFDKSGMTKDQYYDKMSVYLEEEGIVKKTDDKIEKIKKACEIRYKLNVKIAFGIENDYFSKNYDGLPENAKKDVKKLYELTQKTDKYLKKKIGQKKILLKDYEVIVNDFLENKTNLTRIASSDEVSKDTIMKISCHHLGSGKYNIFKTEEDMFEIKTDEDLLKMALKEL